MSATGNDPDATGFGGLTDDAVEAIMRGDQIEGPFAALAAFGRDVQALGERPGPQPTAELATRLPPTSPAQGRPQQARPARSRTGARSASLSRAAKIALGGTVAALGVSGAAAAGVLPDPARDALHDAIDAITPMDDPTPQSDNPDLRPTTTAPELSTQPPDPHPTPDNTGPDPDPGANNPRPDPGANNPDPNPGPNPSANNPNPGSDPSASNPNPGSDPAANNPNPNPSANNP